MTLDLTGWGTAGLWLAVLGSGIYHGVNPGMGWPLAVSAAMMGRGRRDLAAALGSLAGGHFLAMAGILMPFGVMTALVTWQQEIRLAAGLIVLAAGLYLLANPRHPRFLVRIKPTRLALWSFAVATAHGAGLMLLPVYLGLCRAEDLAIGDQAASTLVGGLMANAILVATAHAIAMIAAGGTLAVATYKWLGPQFIARHWFNLDATWALSLVLVGAVSLASLLLAAH